MLGVPLSITAAPSGAVRFSSVIKGKKNMVHEKLSC